MYQVDQNQDAYREGLFARALGRSCDGNPYPGHTREAVLWIHGWWLIQDAEEMAPTEEFGHEQLSRPSRFRFDDVSPNFPRERQRQAIRSFLIHAAETTRSLLTGFLLAATGFFLSYAVLRIFLL